MEICYRREMRHNYLVIKPDEWSGYRYESQMLTENDIVGLLKFHISQSDGEGYFYYEITSKQPLCRILENRNMTVLTLRSLILGIAKVLEQMERYLLPEEQILLEAEYIYIDPESLQICLCLLPGHKQDFPTALGRLLHYLLGYIDHQDKECVVLAYSLYQESQKDNFSMDDLLKFVRGDVKPLERQEEHVERKEPIMINEHSYLTDTRKAINHAEPKTEKEKESVWKKRLTEVISPFAKKSKSENFPEGGGIQKTAAWDKWQEMLQEQETYVDKSEIDVEPVTVLLADFEETHTGYCLRALQKGIEDIFLTSFPFVIGKSGDLADYLLEKDTVSRLHVKIEQFEEGFRITDLNSTNGTRIRGHLLNNNEYTVLFPGDEVQVAEWRYRFEMI